MKTLLLCLTATVLLPSAEALASTASPVWSAYLDYAYVFSSADQDALRERLTGYGEEAGISLETYISEYFETLAPLEAEDGDEASTRRQAIAYLLDYLSRGQPESLERSVTAIQRLRTRLDRHENRYWYHYILAHRALEKGYAPDFVSAILAVWIGVVVPLEAPYETLQTLSLSDAPNSGFVSALPYVYENLARIILIRSQEMGLDRQLDPLAAIVRLLHDGRVGAHPDVIPAAASSRDYLERILQRLEGAESDDGSLTFTLALFEATKHHDQARTLLATEDLGSDTLHAMRRASGAYATALNRAVTVQGQCSVYTRVLRMLGELYAAKQRLGVDPELDIPFSIEGAIQVYTTLRGQLEGDWRSLGYRNADRRLYVEAMVQLWGEIQEASLNAADYYLTRSVENPHRADEYSRSAARVHNRYLSFFHQFATERGKEAVPDSAYFAAFEAARGFGDAILSYASESTPPEVELATRRYRSALTLFPFDRELWPVLTAALGRHGRESEYAELVRPIAERVAHSRAVNTWIENDEVNAAEIRSLRLALSDSLVVMYLGFAEASAIAELEEDLVELVARRERVAHGLEDLTRQRDALRTGGSAPPAAPLDAEGEATEGERRLDLAEVAQRIVDQSALLTKLDQQIEARSRALPLYKQTLGTDGLTRELRSQRDHPVHSLLRRMYHESRVGAVR